jgi:hypothetical protein
MTGYTSAATNLKESGWVNAPAFTWNDYVLVCGRIFSNTNNIGVWSDFTVHTRWIG